MNKTVLKRKKRERDVYMAAQVPPRLPPFLLEFEELLQFFTFNCIEKCSRVLKEKKYIYKEKYGIKVTFAT